MNLILFGLIMLSTSINGIIVDDLPPPPPPRRTSRLRPNSVIASTSTSETLTELEICDLDNHAQTIVNVFFAQDTSSGDLADMARDRPDELNGFFEYIRNIFLYAVHGGQDFWNRVPETLSDNAKQRINYLLRRIIEKILQVLYESCTNNFRAQLAYTYDPDAGGIRFIHNLQVSSSNRCLQCSRASTTSRCDHKLMDRLDINFPEFRLHYNIIENLPHNQHPDRVNGLEIERYHVVPPSLIVRFLTEWLISDHRTALNYHLNEPYHECISSMFNRFKLHLQKIMIHEIKKVYGLSDNHGYNFLELANQEFFYTMYDRWNYQSSGGNNVFGPRERGPFNPTMGIRTPDKITAFEFSFRLLIGEERYQDLLEIYNLLLEYVKNVSEMTLNERLVQGVKIFIKMLSTFEKHKAKPFDLSMWEEGKIDEEDEVELGKRFTAEQIRRFKRTKYWKIKKPARRFPRSIEDQSGICVTIDKLAKRRWNMFVQDSMKSLLDNHAKGNIFQIDWECSFVKLYYSYRFYDKSDDNSANSIVECLKNSNFDSFLYHYLSKMDSWRDCLYHNGTNQPADWCKAWRRIMLNSNAGQDSDWTFTITKSKDYMKDVEIIWDWVIDNIKITEKSAKWIADNPFTAEGQRKIGSQLYNSVCFSTASAVTLGCPNDCSALRASRSVDALASWDRSPAYDQVWFKDVDGIFKCQCPANKKPMTPFKFRTGLLPTIINFLRAAYESLAD